MMFVMFVVMGGAAMGIQTYLTTPKDDYLLSSTGVDPILGGIYAGVKSSGTPLLWDERIVTFPNEGMTMVCTLTVPRTKPGHLCPIVITLNGFTGIRDEATIPGTNEGMLKRASRIMAENGIASLRVDFRGQGDSNNGGSATYAMTSFSSEISDTLAAINYVSNNLKYEVNTNQIGLIGFSQGGLLATYAASHDKRVKSLVLWSPVTQPPIIYQGLLTKEGIQQGLELPDGGEITLQMQIYDFPVTLGKQFFEDLFKYDALAELRSYRNPLMVISASQDRVIWPQPAMGGLYMKYHDGEEAQLLINADHDLSYWNGPEAPELTDAAFWSTAWFLNTLK